MTKSSRATTRYAVSELVEMAGEAPGRPDTLAMYSTTLSDHEVRTDDVPLLTDNYAPTENLLNPVTCAPYEGGDELIPRSVINPIVIAGIWAATLLSIYYISGRVRTAFWRRKNVET